jgi:predicted metal-dependent enzyme (double-stranded beta helix superfamily)
MTISSIEQFGLTFQSLLDRQLAFPEFLAEGRELVASLVASRGWLNNTLARLVLDEAFLQSQYQSGDPNDIILFRSPARSFSVRAFIWEPGVLYPVHDHGSWGIVGSYCNPVREKKFKRLDDGSIEDTAQLELISEAVLKPGQTTYVLPLNEGIHQMATAENLVAITIHIYGSPVRKGYFQTYDMHNQSVHKVYPPTLQKKILIMRALGSMPEAWAQEVLQETIKRAGPDYVAAEGYRALEHLARLK